MSDTSIFGVATLVYEVHLRGPSLATVECADTSLFLGFHSPSIQSEALNGLFAFGPLSPVPRPLLRLLLFDYRLRHRDDGTEGTVEPLEGRFIGRWLLRLFQRLRLTATKRAVHQLLLR